MESYVVVVVVVFVACQPRRVFVVDSVPDVAESTDMEKKNLPREENQ